MTTLRFCSSNRLRSFSSVSARVLALMVKNPSENSSKVAASFVAGVLLLAGNAFVGAANAACVDAATGTYASGGSVCSTAQSSYDATGSAAFATGAGSILNANGVTTIKGNAFNIGVISASAGGVVNITGVTSATPLIITAEGTRSRGLYSTGASSNIVIDGPVQITTGGAASGADYSHGIHTYGGTITIKGSVNIATGISGGAGTGNYGLYAEGGTINVGDAYIRPAGTATSTGAGATAGGIINMGKVDILINGSSQTYTYGVLSDNGSTVTLAGGKVEQTTTASFLTNRSNSALRSITNSMLTVTGDIEIITNGYGARGVYVSGNSTANLNNTNITTKGSASAGIQIGKSRDDGPGAGIVNSSGALVINQPIAGSPGIYIENSGSALNANFAGSSTVINAAGRAILYGGSIAAADPDTVATIALNNATLATTGVNADLIYVGGRVMAGSSLSLTNGSATASSGGWLINVSNRVVSDSFSNGSIYKASDFTFNADNMKLQGSVNTIDDTNGTSILRMKLDNGSVWTLASAGSNTISTLTTLDLNNSTLDASNGDFTLMAREGFTNNGGVIDLSGTAKTAGQMFTIDGNYTATGDATLKIDTVLGDSSSVSDVLAINNGIVSGKTQVIVNNDGGLGAQTTGDGILIVQTTNSTIAAGADFWAPTNSVKAGLYAYNVVRGTQSTDNWYLTSEYVAPPVQPPVDPSSPEPTPEPFRPSLPNIRAEIPVYMTASVLANKLALAMVGTYHDRAGEDYSDTLLLPSQVRDEWCGSGRNKYRCPVTARAYDHKVYAGWARLFGETGNVGYGGKGNAYGRLTKFYKNGPSYDYDMAGFQAGMDIYRREYADGMRDIAGLYVGYGNIDSNIQQVYGGKAGTMT
ncbi:hypothetical protein WJT86_00005, partial [Microvirga sp. W0021]